MGLYWYMPGRLFLTMEYYTQIIFMGMSMCEETRFQVRQLFAEYRCNHIHISKTKGVGESKCDESGKRYKPQKRFFELHYFIVAPSERLLPVNFNLKSS